MYPARIADEIQRQTEKDRLARLEACPADHDGTVLLENDLEVIYDHLEDVLRDLVARLDNAIRAADGYSGLMIRTYDYRPANLAEKPAYWRSEIETHQALMARVRAEIDRTSAAS